MSETGICKSCNEYQEKSSCLRRNLEYVDRAYRRKEQELTEEKQKVEDLARFKAFILGTGVSIIVVAVLQVVMHLLIRP